MPPFFCQLSGYVSRVAMPCCEGWSLSLRVDSPTRRSSLFHISALRRLGAIVGLGKLSRTAYTSRLA